MKITQKLLDGKQSRRTFIKGTAAAMFLGGCAQSKFNRRTPDYGAFDALSRSGQVSGQGDLLLRGGIIVDGSGQPMFKGDLLIKEGRIEMVSDKEILFDGPTIDCSGLVVAPGVIDMHSHMDFVLHAKDSPELFEPFVRQGVTTFVTGNCGFAASGFKQESPYKEQVEEYSVLFSGKRFKFGWDSVSQYREHIARNGMTHNMLTLAGDGTTRISLRGYEPKPMNRDELKEYLYLMEEALEQGAYGASLGLQYEPGIFATRDEMVALARLVKRYDRTLTVHMKAYSSISAAYPLKPFGTPHNLLAIDEMIDIGRETGVNLELSHLIFVGRSSWDTCEDALYRIEQARDLNVNFDTYAYSCGISKLNVILPAWFLESVPAAYQDKRKLRRLRTELTLMTKLLGFGFENIMITNAMHPELDKYNGMYLDEIAKERGMSQFENVIDIAMRTNGQANVLNNGYSSTENVLEMMRHPQSLFMTDATVVADGVQNPGAFGNFPLFLQYARDYGHLSIEEAVHKMTGASAAKFGLEGRGLLKDGYAADIAVFDWKNINDNNTSHVTDAAPDGMQYVFINGAPVLAEGQIVKNQLQGVFL